MPMFARLRLARESSLRCGPPSIPNWLCSHFDKADLDHVRAAVEKAERGTSGEIVALVVRRSTSFGHVIPLLFAFSALILTIIFEEVSYYVAWPLYVFAIGSLLIAAALAYGLGRFDALKRLMTSDADMAESVFHRAQLEFHETGIPATAGRTGVLIMVSMAEHRAVILGDRAISEKLNEGVWIRTIEGLLGQIKAGDFRGGLTTAIEQMGEILAREFPIKPGDKNELPDHMLIRD